MHELPPSSSSRKPPSGPAQPYLEWALATGFSYLREGNWIPLLIEFDADAALRSGGNDKLTALEAFATRRWLHDDPRTLDDKFIVPDLFAKPPALLKTPRASKFNFCVGLIRRDVEAVRELIGTAGWNNGTILRLELGPPVDFATKAPPAPSPEPTSLLPPSPRERGKLGFRRRVKAAIDWVKSKFRGTGRTELPKRAAPMPPAPKPPPVPPPPPPTPPPSASPPGNPRPPGSGSPPATPPPGFSGSAGTAGVSAPPIDRVVIAVIDQGIAFSSSKFFTGGAPCIEYLWQQNVQTVVPAPALVMPFTPGFELNKAAIQTAVAAAAAIGAGEDWLYQNFGGLSFSVDGYKPLAHRRTHGTHVLDLAASVSNSPNKFPVIAVDMPEDAVGDPAGSTLSVQAAWGLIYILDRAEKLRNASANETLPVVVNLSYGPHEGPHDGTAVLETFMDSIWQLADASDTPLEIVLAAGNFRQTRTHGAFSLQAAKRKNLRWRLQPGSLSASLMEIWLPPGGGHNVTVTLTPPFTSAALPPIWVSPAKLSAAITTAGGAVVYSATYVPAPPPSTTDSILLSIARTAPDPAGTWGDALARSGVWRVTLSSTAATPGLNAWIKRSDTLSGRRAKGRQSHFDDPKYPRFDATRRPCDYDPTTSTSYVKRIGTLSGIATGDKTRVIGGYRNSDLYPARYSSHGTRVLGGAPTGPDWLESCEDSDVLRGMLAAGTRSGSVASMSGTSVAAPQATRWIAQDWRGRPKGYRPPTRPGLRPPNVPPHRPIPPVDFAAIGNRLAPFAPRWPPRR